MFHTCPQKFVKKQYNEMFGNISQTSLLVKYSYSKNVLMIKAYENISRVAS